MSRDNENLRSTQHSGVNAGTGHDIDFDAEHRPEVARRASLAGLRHEAARLQMKQDAGAVRSTEPVHDAAARGIASPTTALPHATQIQASFGARHDVSKIQAHVGGDAAGAMGATAFASGDHVVFDRSPDLHTAAHEAAHVVQQAHGVNLYGGVGEAGDSHERHADAVADRVVAGQSAADLLGAPTTSTTGGTVQRKAAPDISAASTEDRQAQRADTHQASSEGLYSAVTFESKEMLVRADAIEAHLAAPSDEAGPWRRFEAIATLVEAARSRVDKLSADLALAIKAQGPEHDLKHALAVFARAYTRFYGAMHRAHFAAQKVNETQQFSKEIQVAVVDMVAFNQAVEHLFTKVGWNDGRPDEAHAQLVSRKDWESLKQPENQLLAQALEDNLHATFESAHLARMSAGGVDDSVLATDCSRAIAHAGELADLLAQASDKTLHAHRSKIVKALNELHHLQKAVAGKPVAGKLAGSVFEHNLEMISKKAGR
jgi:hypothetical protein